MYFAHTIVQATYFYKYRVQTSRSDTPSERRITERRITERPITERRITERRITECRITERRKLPNAENYPTSNITQRRILQNIL